MNDAVYRCPHCGQMFNGSNEDVGMVAECPSCGNAFALKTLNDVLGKRPNGFMCYLGILRNYFVFTGRLRRREFWWAFIFWWVSYLVSLIVDFVIWGSPKWCTVIVSLGTLIPLVAAQVRRLHDTNKSGWWLPLI